MVVPDDSNPASFHRLFLLDGDYDVAINGIEITPARAALVSFSRPYYVADLRLAAAGR